MRFSENIRLAVSKLKLSKQGSYVKEELVAYMNECEDEAQENHVKLIVKLGCYRGFLDPIEYKRLVSVIQVTYLACYAQNVAVDNEVEIDLYPGDFIRLLSKEFAHEKWVTDVVENPLQGVEYLNYLVDDLKGADIDFKPLQSLCSNELVWLVESDVWQAYVSELLGAFKNPLSSGTLNGVIESHAALQNELNRIKVMSHSRRFSTENRRDIKQDNWYLIAQVLTESVMSDIPSADVNICVHSRTLHFDNRVINLKSSFFADLLVLFSIYENEGVMLKTIQQFELEKKMSHSERLSEFCWKEVDDKDEYLYESSLNRLFVSINKLNILLSSFGLKIGKFKGKQGLVVLLKQTGRPVTIGVVKKIETDSDVNHVPCPQVMMKKREQLIWNYCLSHYQNFFSYRALALEITLHKFKAESITSEEISKILYCFSKKVLAHTNFELVSDRRGAYCLVKNTQKNSL